VGALADRLLDRMPTQSVTALVHGDYKLDNCLVGDDGSMRAVVDWELAALGDPRADLGLLNAYWAEPDDDPPVLPSVSSAPGFLTRAELVDAYEQATGAPLRDEEYFLAFGWWKALCILESVYGRLRAREDSERTRYLGEHVLGLARSADRLLV
jgi:aminoglycoside phosphotransferase (APT) family kinase protein